MVAVAALTATHAQGQVPAAPPSPNVPSLQQNPIERLQPAAPVQVAPSIQAPPPTANTGPGAAREIRVMGVTVTGNDAMPEARLEHILGPLRGQTVALARIDEARIGLVTAYRLAGYPFVTADAGVTPRPDGSVDLAFQVTEGFVAEVKLEGDVGPAGRQVLRFLERVTAEKPVTATGLERALLLASDIPGLTVRGLVRPLATERGALQLVAQVSRRPFSGYIGMDNRGSDFAGPWQGLTSASANSFTEFGERSELSFFIAERTEQWFVQAAVEAFIGGSGLRARIWGGAGQARPGSVLAQIGYRGFTTLAGGSLTYPIFRRRPFSVFAVAQFDAFSSDVETGGNGVPISRASHDELRSFRAGFDTQALDSWIPFLPAATTIGNIRVHQGISALGATRSGDPLSARAGSRYDYTKFTGDFQRTQPLFDVAEGWSLSVMGLLSGQYSGDVLPSVEKFYLGGSRLNRGYYAGQLTGDKAFTWGAELQLSTRFELPWEMPWGLTNTADAQFYIFRDDGRVWQNVSTDRNGRLASSGLGLRLVVSDTLQLDFEGVRRDTRRPTGANTDALARDAFFFRTLVRF